MLWHLLKSKRTGWCNTMKAFYNEQLGLGVDMMRLASPSPLNLTCFPALSDFPLTSHLTLPILLVFLLISLRPPFLYVIIPLPNLTTCLNLSRALPLYPSALSVSRSDLVWCVLGRLWLWPCSRDVRCSGTQSTSLGLCPSSTAMHISFSCWGERLLGQTFQSRTIWGPLVEVSNSSCLQSRSLCWAQQCARLCSKWPRWFSAKSAHRSILPDSTYSYLIKSLGEKYLQHNKLHVPC